MIEINSLNKSKNVVGVGHVTNNSLRVFLIMINLLPHRGLPLWRGGGAYAPMTQTII